MSNSFNKNIKEIWKDIIGYEKLYQVSNYGKVKRLAGSPKCKKDKILKPNTNNGGYLYINLHKNGKSKTFYIHRLVLESFVGPLPFGMESCHNNGNQKNNFIQNLRYDTRSNNMKDQIKHGTIRNQHGIKNSMAKINDKKVLEIRKLHSIGISEKEIAKLYGLCRQSINEIVNRKTWKHVD